MTLLPYDRRFYYTRASAEQTRVQGAFHSGQRLFNNKKLPNRPSIFGCLSRSLYASSSSSSSSSPTLFLLRLQEKIPYFSTVI